MGVWRTIRTSFLAAVCGLSLSACDLFGSDDEMPEDECRAYDGDRGLHLYLTGEAGGALEHGHYDLRLYIGKQVIRSTCTVSLAGSDCSKATGFDGIEHRVYGYVQTEAAAPGVIEFVMMQNEGRFTGGPEHVQLNLVKDETLEWGPLQIWPVYDRLTPDREHCGTYEVSHLEAPISFAELGTTDETGTAQAHDDD